MGDAWIEFIVGNIIGVLLGFLVFWFVIKKHIDKEIKDKK